MALGPRTPIPQENVDRVEQMLGLTHTAPTYGIGESGIGLNFQGGDEVMVRVEYVGKVDVATATEIMRLLNGGEL